MKLIIAGSRNIAQISFIRQAMSIVQSKVEVTEIVSGNARGVDSLGEQFAKENNIPLKLFPADWNKYGRAAGMRRNAEMAEYADGLLAIWDGISTGTNNMINTMKLKRKRCFVYTKRTEVKELCVLD